MQKGKRFRFWLIVGAGAVTLAVLVVQLITRGQFIELIVGLIEGRVGFDLEFYDHITPLDSGER